MSTNSIHATYINGKMPNYISDKWLFKVLHVASYVNSEFVRLAQFCFCSVTYVFSLNVRVGQLSLNRSLGGDISQWLA